MLNHKFLSAASIALAIGLLTPAQSSAAMVDIGALGTYTDSLLNTSNVSFAYGVSGNGSVIVGNSYNGTASHAFKYVGTTMTDLGALGPNTDALTGINANPLLNNSNLSSSGANAVSRDGTVIVGNSFNGTVRHAFKYVGTTMTDLGALGANTDALTGINANPLLNTSNRSEASAVSGGGLVIVGRSDNGLVDHAFKYVGTTMTDLGALGPNTDALTGINANPLLNTANDSRAYGVSGDGLVVVGQSDNGTADHAFKYVGTTMTDLGALGPNTDALTGINANPLLNTANDSRAYGVSGDGLVIVGRSFNGTAIHAFKYVGTTMTDLGALGPNTDALTGINANPLLNTANYSEAFAVSGDGLVIVGYSYIGTTDHAFKYVGTTMTDLGVLGTNPASNESRAHAVSEDGSIIVGYSDTDTATHAFVYTDAGMLDAVEWMQSISGPAGIMPMVTSLSSLPMEGAHHRPLMSLDAMGKTSQSWVTGDFGARSRTSDSNTTSGEAGVSSTFGRVIAGLAVGYSEQNNDLLFGGSSNISGQYILGEVDMRLSDNKSIVSLTTMIGNWKSKTLRGYGVGGGGVDYSLGSTSLNSMSVRLRIDGAPHKLIRGPSITPFASFTWSRTTADAYSESGGSYDAQFNKQSHVSKEGRVGLSTNFKLGKSTTLLTTLEWIHRFDKNESSFSGTDIDHGALPFNVAGSAIRSNQARLGFDVDHKVNPTTMLNFSAHVTSVGEAPDISGALSIRRAF